MYNYNYQLETLVAKLQRELDECEKQLNERITQSRQLVQEYNDLAESLLPFAEEIIEDLDPKLEVEIRSYYQ